jgi:GcrA cell cycle regulator
MSEKHIGNDNSRKWTSEHDAMLRKLREDGFSSTQIGIAVNVEFHTFYTRNAVIGRCHRLGLTKQKNPPGPPKPRVRTTPFREPGMPVNKPPELRCVEANPRNIPLLDLEPGQCRWPYGDGPFTFCGYPALTDLSYCGAHTRLSMRRGTA